MIESIMQLLRTFWRYIHELSEYKRQYGSSCCMPVHCGEEHNPFRFNEHERTHHPHKDNNDCQK